MRNATLTETRGMTIIGVENITLVDSTLTEYFVLIFEGKRIAFQINPILKSLRILTAIELENDIKQRGEKVTFYREDMDMHLDLVPYMNQKLITYEIRSFLEVAESDITLKFESWEIHIGAHNGVLSYSEPPCITPCCEAINYA